MDLMCGFVGTLTNNCSISSKIDKASDLLSHWGPDDSKTYKDGMKFTE